MGSAFGKIFGEAILGGALDEDLEAELTDAAIEATFEATKVRAMRALRPHLAKVLARHGLKWQDVLDAVQRVELQDLHAALEDPEAFLLSCCFAGAKGLAIHKLRAAAKACLRPMAEKRGVPWAQLEPSLEKAIALINSVSLEQVEVCTVSSCQTDTMHKSPLIALIRPCTLSLSLCACRPSCKTRSCFWRSSSGRAHLLC